VKNAPVLSIAIYSLLVLCPFVCQVSPCFAKYSGGAGTADDPYQIATADDLLAMAADTDDYDKYFIITADIDLSDNSFTTAVIAIDTDDELFEFTGDFNGNGHIISNLTINTNGAGYLGLFGKIGSTGKIENLRLTNVKITCGDSSYYLGGLAGDNYGVISNCSSSGAIESGVDFGNAGGLVGDNEGDINNCSSSVAITCGYNPGLVGGLVGFNYDGNIIDSFSTGDVSGGNESAYVGGLVGLNANDNARIRNCYSTGKVMVADDSEYVGGLVGENIGNISNCSSTSAVAGGKGLWGIGGLVGDNLSRGVIKACSSTGDVNVEDDLQYIGGLVGENRGSVSNCSSTGFVKSRAGADNLGGLVGWNNSGSIHDCCSTGTVSGGDDSYDIGGLVGQNEEGEVNNCYSTGSVTGGYGASDLGGLVGYNFNGNVSNCYSTGTVTSGDESYDVGGLVGWTEEGDISNCYSTGSVTGGSRASDLGGLVGVNYSGNISNCYSTGTVAGGDDSYDIGGLVGLYEEGNIQNSYFLDTSGPDNGYGQPLTDAQMKKQSSFFSWDFVYTWQISEGIRYPQLAWQLNCDTAPLPPTGVSASSGNYTDRVQVTWDSALGAAAYEVWRGTESDSSSASNLGDYSSPFDDSNVIPGTKYYYWIKARNECWTSDFSSSDSGYACVVLSAPTGVYASDGSYTNKAQVIWDSVSGATGYEVWRSVENNSSSASKLGDYASPFDDFSAIPGTTYYYWVKATSECWTSYFSSSDSGYACPVPSVPTGVLASDGGYTNKVRVTWDSVSGATGYEVWRSDFDNLASANKLGDCKQSPFDDSSVITEKTYYYWVKARNDCVKGDFGSSNRGYSSAIPKALSITKCSVTAGSKGKGTISLSGKMNPTYDDLYLTNVIQIVIGSDDMVAPYVIVIPINNAGYKKTGKFSYSGTDADGVKKSFTLDFKTSKFSFSAQNINLSGLSCPLKVGVVITKFEVNTIVDEAIVNGTKPMPINLLMGVKNSLRLDKSKFTRNKKTGPITQMAVSGRFTVANISDANLAANPFYVTVGSDSRIGFRLPIGSFKASKNGDKFTCSKFDTSNGIADATFDFNKCTFTLTIKKTNFPASAGAADLTMEFGGFSEGAEVLLP
jgi:hypothetical protein